MNVVIKIFSKLMLSMMDKNFYRWQNILKYFFLFFPVNRLWHFMQIVLGDNLHEMSKPVL